METALAAVILSLAGMGILLAFWVLRIFGALMVAWPLMWAWNYVIPTLFGLIELSYWQAFCLLLVCQFLIKSSNAAYTNNEKKS